MNDDLQEAFKRIQGGLAETLQRAGIDPAQADLILEGRPSARLSGERSLALLIIDADSIQDEILASPRPVTISGASGRLGGWEKDLVREKDGLVQEAGATVLFAGGGNAVLVVPATRAEKLAHDLKQEFKKKTGGSASTASILVSPKDLAQGPPPSKAAPELLARLGITGEGGRSFGGCMDNLLLEMRACKGAGKKIRPPVEGPRCAECRIRPREADTLCLTCRERRDAGGQMKDGPSGQARTFAELFRDADRIAYIYVDGRGIGKILSACTSLQDYVRFSHLLKDGFGLDPQEYERLGIAGQDRVSILSGGDDLLLVVPARVDPDPLTLTRDIIRRIEERINRELPPHMPRVGAGAGVVITGTLAADFCIGRARLLCKNAKTALERPRGSNAPEQFSAIDYEVLLDGSPLSDSPDATRKAEAIDVVGGAAPVPGMRKLMRTQRPYPLDRFDALLDAARKIKTVPHSQLMTLRNAFEGDVTTAMITVLYQASRDPVLKDALGIGDLTQRMDQISPFLLRPRPQDAAEGLWDSALSDLIEVRGMLSARPTGDRT